MKKLIFAILFAIATISCSKNEPTENIIFQPVTITPTLIYNSELYGNGRENISEQKTVISTANDWNDLKIKMNSQNPFNNISFPNIDFATEKVIAIFDKIWTRDGANISISNIIETENQIVVTVFKTEPGPFTNGITSVSQPFYIVKIPQTSKPIVFN